MHYSTGMKNRLGIARSLLNDPEILLFDEITSGLDPTSALGIRNLIKKLSTDQDKTVFLTSHNMEEINYLCDNVAMLYSGKVIANDSPRKLKNQFIKSMVVKAELDKRITGLSKELEKLSKVDHARQDITHLIVHCKKGLDIGKITEVVEDKGGQIKKITSIEPTMEDVFLRLVKEKGGK
jgi:ABC-2 type transport system ATP-binding protein